MAMAFRSCGGIELNPLLPGPTYKRCNLLTDSTFELLALSACVGVYVDVYLLMANREDTKAMSQLTLYVDEETRRRIERAARQANLSVSRWVVRTISQSLELTWPPAYFELIGSLDDDDLRRPPQGRLSDDHFREDLAK